MFSFNSPLGAVRNAGELDQFMRFDADLILNKKLTILEGGILPFNKLLFHETWYIRLLKKAAEEENIDLNIPIGKLTDKQLKIILYGLKNLSCSRI
jgi:excinuclease ABC subunit A